MESDGIVFSPPPYRIESVVQGMSGETVDWGLRIFNIPDHWVKTQGAGVRVGVADTGVQADHPDLQDAVENAKDFTGSPYGTADRQGHGSHCCGIIAARQNGLGMVGVAPKAKIVMAKVLDDNGSGSSQSVAYGILWLAEQGCDVISVSLGSGQHSPQIYEAVKQAVSLGSTIVAAMGNSGPAPNTGIYPGKYSEVIGVASCKVTKEISQFSSRDPQVDVAAPGENIYSTVPPSRYATYSGTSMATPYVAGVLALYISLRRQTDPSYRLNPVDSLRIIRDTAVDAGDPGPDPVYGYGLINPDGILMSAPVPPLPPPPPVPGDRTYLLTVPADTSKTPIVTPTT